MSDTDPQSTESESPGSATDAPPAEYDTERVEGLVDRLTLDEKIALVHGDVDPIDDATGYLPGVERLGIPPLRLVDGPTGVRSHTSTAFPSSIALAATWDPDLARDFGAALASEVRGANHDVVLAPGVNIVRVPQCGRAFEYYSEDPELAASMGAGTVEGIQSAGVVATVKHFVANNQEVGRHHASSEVGERALREIYLPAFERAVKDAGVGSVMAAYNRVDGTYMTEHRRLLTDVLKDEWGFSGFVVSDWWATSDGVAAARAGLDLDMPGVPMYEWHVREMPVDGLLGSLPDSLPRQEIADLLTTPWIPDADNPNLMLDSPFDDPLREAVTRGEVGESLLDEKVRRVLGQMERFGMLDGEQPDGDLDAPAHHDLTQEIAELGTVLLRNEDDVLPLADDADVAVVGPNADTAKVGGGGSSEVDPARATDPLSGVRERAGGEVRFARGVPRVEESEMVGGLRGWLGLGDDGGESSDPAIADALTTVREADVAVVFVQDAATETADRSLWLPGEQDELVGRVADAADRTVVVCNTGGPVRMPWAADVDAVLAGWYQGQAHGEAVGSVLYGDADPGGRLPVTFGRRLDDYPTGEKRRYPGVDDQVHYDEGVFVGYRGFDADDTEPLFPFGHGDSYADFEYGDPAAEGEVESGLTVSVPVENVSDREGREVVQVYVHDVEASVERPPTELAAFAAVDLDGGESRTVTCDLGPRDFAFYDEESEAWTVEAGEFELLVGRSSRDVRGRVTVEVETDLTAS
ncbi:MAG: glycoside hydrolase family 3 C-terminal domain-containing protein [Halobacteriaceae archaeon]